MKTIIFYFKDKKLDEESKDKASALLKKNGFNVLRIGKDSIASKVPLEIMDKAFIKDTLVQHEDGFASAQVTSELAVYFDSIEMISKKDTAPQIKF